MSPHPGAAAVPASEVHARLAFQASGLASHGALRLDFGAPRTVLRADALSEVVPVLDAAARQCRQPRRAGAQPLA